MDGSAAIAKSRGLTPEKAFKTINACILYICNNYNLGQYSIIIYISAHDYSDSNLGAVTLRSFNSSGGVIYLTGVGQGKTILPTINTASNSNCVWYVRKLTVTGNREFGTYGRWVFANGNIFLYLQSVTLDVRFKRYDDGYYDIPIEVSDGATCGVMADDIEENGKGLTIDLRNSTAECYYLINSRSGGNFVYSADIHIGIGSGTYTGNGRLKAVAISQKLALIERTTSIRPYPGRAPNLTCNGTLACAKYWCTLNGIINSSGQASNWPANQAGQIDTGGQVS